MNEKKQVKLKLQGATCPSCMYTIEKAGRKISGISEIKVDAASRTIDIEFDGDNNSLLKIQSLVRKIGYDAEIPAEYSKK